MLSDTPRTIVRRAAMLYVGGQIMITVGLLHAWKTGDHRLARMIGYFIAFWGPWVLVVTYKQAITAWRGLSPNDLADVSIPTLWLATIGTALYVIAH